MHVKVFEDQAPLVIFVGIVLVLVSALALAYAQSSKTRPEQARRRASWIAAFASGAVALFATLEIALPVLEDLHNPGGRSRSALIGAIIVCVVCLCIWGITVRCIISAVRKGSTD